MGSQDSQICEKCSKPCGYDDSKGYYDPGYLCDQCKLNLIRRFSAVFGIENASSNEWGIDVSWRNADRILGRLRRDWAMRIIYYVTDKELWERKTDIRVSVLEE